ncbi:hypothetical protein [Allocoleopsis sp.]|uniref:hypothetical protein n=1 Tax=Allocoleopsis sp. TaxID=3088169 RepID=UPI002FCF28F1
MTSDRSFFDSLIKYDLSNGSSQTHEFEAGRYGGEAVFVPLLSNTSTGLAIKEGRGDKQSLSPARREVYLWSSQLTCNEM